MGISIYSFVGLIIFSVLIVAGLIVKVALYRKRKALEGFHGYEITPHDNQDDGYRLL